MANDPTSKKIISIPVQRRNFIKDISLPPLPRLRLYDPSSKPRGMRKIRRKLGQVADDIVHGWIGLPARGYFTIQLANGASGTFEFDAHQSAYLAFISRALYGSYEPTETMFLEAMLVRSRCFYDIGANWGYYTLVAATHPDYNGNIYAFEISDEMNSSLFRMARDLSLESVKVMECGLSDHSGYVVTNADPATHLNKVVSISDGGRHRGAEAKVVRLDDLDLPPPDLMKIDVEDHELEVLTGGRKLLDEHRPIILFESRDGGDGEKVGELLRAYGYRLYGLRQRARADDILELAPLLPGDASFSHHSNLVAVPIGDEKRWFET